MLTERRTPTATNIGFACGNACHIYEGRPWTSSCPGAYQANTPTKGVREGTNDLDGWIEPLGPSLIAIYGLLQSMELLVKDGENFVRRAAFLELGGEGMANKILFCALFVGIQRTIEDQSEIG